MTRQTTPQAVADLVLERDGGRCVRCGAHVGEGERGRDYSIHHRRIKGMGGDKRPTTDRPPNLIVLCGDGVSQCHGYVHLEGRKDADLHGWIIPRVLERPDWEPLLYTCADGERRWMFLTDDGQLSERRPGGTA